MRISVINLPLFLWQVEGGEAEMVLTRESFHSSHSKGLSVMVPSFSLDATGVKKLDAAGAVFLETAGERKRGWGGEVAQCRGTTAVSLLYKFCKIVVHSATVCTFAFGYQSNWFRLKSGYERTTFSLGQWEGSLKSNRTSTKVFALTKQALQTWSWCASVKVVFFLPLLHCPLVVGTGRRRAVVQSETLTVYLLQIVEVVG